MLRIIQESDSEQENLILSRLKADNRDMCRWLQEHPISDDNHYNFMLYDETELVGGATGCITYDWYFLELLHIEKTYRGKGLGVKLLRKIEDFAKQRSLTGIRLETWNFQARDFYEKLGYSVFGELENCPPETKLYFMKKLLKS